MSADLSVSERVLGTAQEEFDIATGYWAKWQRCKDEKAELLEAARELLDAIPDYAESELFPLMLKMDTAIVKEGGRE